MKRRMVVVGGVIVIVVVLLLAFVGAGSSASVVSVAEAATGDYAGKKVQVTGAVAENSYAVDEAGVLTFAIRPEGEEGSSDRLGVSYDKGVSATFGNGVTAICTGLMDADGTLVCTELVTKCPSKYENAASALTVDKLLGYEPGTMVGNTVKVVGTVHALGPATQEFRLQLFGETAEQLGEDGLATAGLKQPVVLQVKFGGALSDEVVDGASVVLTGALDDKAGTFLATDVALEA